MPRRMLVISNSYANFQKDPIDMVASYFESIEVLVRYNPLAQISRYLNIDSFNAYTKESLIDLYDKPINVNVNPTPIIYAPISWYYLRLGEMHFKVVDRFIMKHKIKFDLIHAHFLSSAGYVGARLKEKYGVPLIVTGHGYDVYDLPFRNEKWRRQIAYVLDAADYVTTVSERNLHCLEQISNKHTYMVIHNGYRGGLFHKADQYECRLKLKLPLDKKIILAIGNLVEIKNHLFLIKVLSKVVDKRNDFLCIILGSGKLKKYLQNYIYKYELQNNIIMIEKQPHNEIPLWINSCDLFVLPSIKEGLPTVHIEAMACGKPVVATYNGGSEELVTSDQYGYLVKQGDIDDFADKILKGLENSWDEDNIALYSKKYELGNIAQQYISLYGSII